MRIVLRRGEPGAVRERKKGKDMPIHDNKIKRISQDTCGLFGAQAAHVLMLQIGSLEGIGKNNEMEEHF